MTYILVDSLNMFYRARHVVRGDDIETKIGMAYHIMFSAINKAWRDFGGKLVLRVAVGARTITLLIKQIVK